MLSIITGAPFSGRRHLYDLRASASSFLFSFPELRQTLAPKGEDTGETTERLIKAFFDLFLIEANKDEAREYWIITERLTQDIKTRLSGIPYQVHKTRANQAELLAKAETEEQRKQIQAYFKSPEIHHKFYKTQEWRDLRAFILKRDGYLCQECKRYGKKTQATEVHHANPLREAPEHKKNPKYLISLCSACHKKMHIQQTETLSKAGKALLRRLQLSENF